MWQRESGEVYVYLFRVYLELMSFNSLFLLLLEMHHSYLPIRFPFELRHFPLFPASCRPVEVSESESVQYNVIFKPLDKHLFSYVNPLHCILNFSICHGQLGNCFVKLNLNIFPLYIAYVWIDLYRAKHPTNQTYTSTLQIDWYLNRLREMSIAYLTYR